MVVTRKITVFWSCLADRYHRFGGISSHHLQEVGGSRFLGNVGIYLPKQSLYSLPLYAQYVLWIGISVICNNELC
jgi:hypothetical protein